MWRGVGRGGGEVNRTWNGVDVAHCSPVLHGFGYLFPIHPNTSSLPFNSLPFPPRSLPAPSLSLPTPPHLPVWQRALRPRHVEPVPARLNAHVAAQLQQRGGGLGPAELYEAVQLAVDQPGVDHLLRGERGVVNTSPN